MVAQLNFKSVLLVCAWFIFTGAQNLEKCTLIGDPHIVEFHGPNTTPRAQKHCLNSHNLLILNNSYVLLRSIVTNQHLMVEFDFQFRSVPNGPIICTLTSNNFRVQSSIACVAAGVVSKIQESTTTLTVRVEYPPAGLLVVITHIKNHGHRFYEMFIWMNTILTSQDNGACRTQTCPIASSSMGKRSAQSYINNMTNVSNATAARLCQAYIDVYLSTLQRSPSQRDADYNRTIENALEACIFDTITLGAGMAFGVTTSIIIEELTTGLNNLTAIESRLNATLDLALSVANELAMNLTTQVIRILNDTNPQTTTTMVSSLSTQTTAMMSSTTRPMTSPSTSTVDSGASILQISLILPLIAVYFLH